MRILDLFSGGGGAAVGMWKACPDAEIVGIDIRPQPEYPFRFIQMDVLRLLELEQLWQWFSKKFDFIWASPPCQGYSTVARQWRHNQDLPRLIPATRNLLARAGVPYCIENVEAAPLHTPTRLCGEMFGLGVIRHRLFETNWSCPEPPHVPHKRAIRLPGRVRKQSQYCSVAGHGGDSNSYKLRDWQMAMGISWINDRKTLVEAVPPAYSQYILSQFLQYRLGA